jgi:hypothetical protein
MNLNLGSKTPALLLALALCGCGAATGNRDGGGGSGGSGGGGGVMDLSGGGGDSGGLACNMPGACGGGAGVCCTRSIGPHEAIFCDTANRCPFDHGVDTSQAPLCNSVADCYAATPRDRGPLYCCPDPNFPGAGISVCRFAACP